MQHSDPNFKKKIIIKDAVLLYSNTILPKIHYYWVCSTILIQRHSHLNREQWNPWSKKAQKRSNIKIMFIVTFMLQGIIHYDLEG